MPILSTPLRVTSLPTSTPAQDGPALLRRTTEEWRTRGGDLWVFGYASLIWRPEFDFLERRDARVYGWHRALKMWSRINRGTRECPGLVFCLLAGGSCQGMVFRVAEAQGEATLAQLWQREMPMPVYTPRWLPCRTGAGVAPALAFTLPQSSPSHTGVLSTHEYQRIFQQASGRYGTTKDYAQSTADGLRAVGMPDERLERLLQSARDADPAQVPGATGETSSRND